MTTLVLAALALHAACLAGVFLAARHSALLVDEEGRPLRRGGTWHEHQVPAVDSRDHTAV